MIFNSRELAKGQTGKVLSEGEKSIVAFAYYLGDAHIKVNSEEDYKRLFFIIDDSISSMDFSYVYSLSGVIREIQNIIRDLKAKGIGVLITDHNVRETLGICDYAYILKDGIIQVSGNSEQIANSETARKFYLGENFKL